MRKGLSIFLEAVLIVAITMTVAIVVTKWYKSYAETQTTEMEENVDIACEYQTLGVDRAVYKDSTATLELVLRATGTRYVSVSKITVVNSSYYQKDYINGQDFFLKRIAPDETESVTLEKITPNITEIRIVLKTCGMNSITIKRDEIQVM